MNIMIDYDGTFGLAPKDWMAVIRLMEDQGHRFWLVTSRDESTPIDHDWWFNENQIPIIYCAYRAKKTVCDEQGVMIDIWIDNDPEYIVKGFLPDEAYHREDRPKTGDDVRRLAREYY